MLEHTIEAIRRLRREGKTCRLTAEALGVSKSSVHRIAPGHKRRCPTCGATLIGRKACLSCQLEEPHHQEIQETSPAAGTQPPGRSSEMPPAA